MSSRLSEASNGPKGVSHLRHFLNAGIWSYLPQQVQVFLRVAVSSVRSKQTDA